MAKLWQKQGLKKLHPDVEKYEVGADYLLDGRLFFYELASSLAHARMLNKIGILTKKEMYKINKEINILYKKHGRTLTLEVSDEDIHSKLENMLTQSIGETGKKIHTGRSRNDQVLTVLRLYEKDRLFEIAAGYIDCLSALAGMAEKEGKKILPGYTHTKQAMLMNVKFWAGAFIEAGLDNIKLLKALLDLIDANPLGSGSGFGVPIPLDRKMTARQLGFSRVQDNAMAVQNSRGKYEGLIIDVLWGMMSDFSRLASDLIMFNMDELLYVKTDSSITTGSSIMPQKRNLDVMELVRARTYTMLSFSTAVKSISSGLISGYNRDLQETKEPLMKALDLMIDTIRAIKAVIENIAFDEESVKNKLTKGIFATDIAFKAAADGVPFRDAYKTAAKGIDDIELNDNTIQSSIRKRISQGSPASINILYYRKNLAVEKKYFDKLIENFRGKLNTLLK